VRVGGAGTPGSEISNVPRLTDDRGEYRLFHIPAGQYFLMVTDESQNGTGSQPSWLPVYFPGTLAATDAIPLTLGRSEEATGINVIFSRSRGTRVSGHLLNEAGQPVRTQVRLTAATPFNGMPLPARVTVSGEDGRFEFASVLPGQYTLRAATSAVTAAVGQTLFVMVSGAAPTPATSAPPTEYGVLAIDAQGEEVGPMVVQMRPGASISGRLVLETSGPRGEPPAFTFAAIAAGESYGMSDPPMLQASIDPDFQSFRISGVSGTMRLRLASGQQNWWLRSATINGVDATESPITLMSSRDSTSDAVFVLADTAGSISGRATSGQAPLEDGWAIVFPVDRDQRFNGSQRVMAVNLYIGGRFTASNVPPGDYYVAAVEGLAPLPQNELRFRDLLEELTPRARRVTVGPRQTVTLTQSVPGTAR